MFTRRLDAALDAIAACQRKLPDLVDVYPLDDPRRAALRKALAALGEAKTALFSQHQG
jgi:hypothetical protein